MIGAGIRKTTQLLLRNGAVLGVAVSPVPPSVHTHTSFPHTNEQL